MLFIEADPKNFHGLKQNRINSINIHAALCSSPQILHFTQHENNAVNGFVEFMSPLFLHMWHKQYAEKPELIQTLPTILCLPLKTLLSELSIKHIDIWFLDVEGAELNVLEGINFNTVTISTIIMECDGRDGEKDKQKQNLLIKNNYLCKKVSFLSLFFIFL